MNETFVLYRLDQRERVCVFVYEPLARVKRFAPFHVTSKNSIMFSGFPEKVLLCSYRPTEIDHKAKKQIVFMSSVWPSVLIYLSTVCLIVRLCEKIHMISYRSSWVA